MSGSTKAKAAARDFLAAVSDDVYVGIVAFAGEVTTVQEPSRDRAESVSLLRHSTLSLQTRLYDGVQEALAASGTEGQRTVLVLSDGARHVRHHAWRTPSPTVEDSGARVDVVALAQAPAGRPPWSRSPPPDGATVLAGRRPRRAGCRVLGRGGGPRPAAAGHSATPADLDSQEGTLAVSVEAEGETYTVPGVRHTHQCLGARRRRRQSHRSRHSLASTSRRTLMLAGLGAAGVAVLLLLAAAFGVLSPAKESTVEERVAAYTRPCLPRRAHAASSACHVSRARGSAQSALGAAEQRSASNAGVAASIGGPPRGRRHVPEAGGVGAHPRRRRGRSGMLGFLLGGGSAAGMVLFLALRRDRALAVSGLQAEPAPQRVQRPARRHASTDLRRSVRGAFAGSVGRHRRPPGGRTDEDGVQDERSSRPDSACRSRMLSSRSRSACRARTSNGS